MSQHPEGGVDTPAPAEPAPRTGRFSRRALLGGAAGGLAIGAVAGVGVGRAYAGSGDGSEQGPADTAELAHPFYDQVHQGGIRTSPQRYAMFAAFDLTTTSTQGLQVLLARWSAAIAQLQQGRPLGSVQPERPNAVPTDTGEATDLGPYGLTVTLGLGPGVFDDRFGLTDKRPAHLAPLPRIQSDQLVERMTGGDLGLQVCADDPQVVYHTVRDLARWARGTATIRWTVMGFGRASAGPDQVTPRNLMGFRDGTRNVATDADYDAFVWAGADDQPWMAGGTYQVVRKIRMHIENWDVQTIDNQQTIFGRSKLEGAPLTGVKEHDVPDFTATDADGAPVIDVTSHVGLAAFENNGGLKILRRGYNYTEGLNPDAQLDAGLLFIAFMNTPEAFITLQKKLGRSDLLNEYLAHVGSAVFAIPPAPAKGSYIGQALFT